MQQYMSRGNMEKSVFAFKHFLNKIYTLQKALLEEKAFCSGFQFPYLR